MNNQVKALNELDEKSANLGHLPISPSELEARSAVEILIRLAGDDPKRAGLKNTPKNVVRAFEEYFSGYDRNPQEELRQALSPTKGFKDIVALTNIDFVSHCEHHIVPFYGVAHLGFIPRNQLVGVGKLASVVDIFSRRLQTQERLTQEIGRCLEEVLEARGVAVVIKAKHHCLNSRGAKKTDAQLATSFFSGVFEVDARTSTREHFMQLIA